MQFEWGLFPDFITHTLLILIFILIEYFFFGGGGENSPSMSKSTHELMVLHASLTCVTQISACTMFALYSLPCVK